MGKVLIVGSGKVANVTARKCCEQPEIFGEMCLTARTKNRCDDLKRELSDSRTKVISAAVDVTNPDKTLLTVKIFKPDLVINLAPPHLNLKVMDICLQARANYIDASYYYPKGSTACGLKEQLSYSGRFEKAGLTAVVGCGFNPGVIGIFIEYARQKLFDRILSVDIIDANAGKNGYPYRMNSPIGKNIRELSSPARYYEAGEWKSAEPLEREYAYSFPEVGRSEMYLLDHESLEHLVAVTQAERLRCFGSFKKPFLTMIRNLQCAGMTSAEPICIGGVKISPLAFLEEVFPSPQDLASETTGKTGIGCIISGEKDGKARNCMLYSVADHEKTYTDLMSSANDFMVGVPVTVAAEMILSGTVSAKGVHTAEIFDPESFLTRMSDAGLSWKEKAKPSIIAD
ncbi:MAG: saccharopine dehydrogenase family protein [Clostridiaceae bacterium]|nr:saccharopine dehydrogenase family protein [Clostridiaceae bacterium]